MNFKINYPLVSLIIIFIMISYSIIDYNFLNNKPKINIREHNLEKIREFNLADLYNQKNLNHNQVRIWILNNTDQTGLASKMRGVLQSMFQEYGRNRQPLFVFSLRQMGSR